jgi:hypothetical protein
MALVDLDSVSKSYPRRVGLRTELHAVAENVSFSIEAGNAPREAYTRQLLEATPELPPGAA